MPIRNPLLFPISSFFSLTAAGGGAPLLLFVCASVCPCICIVCISEHVCVCGVCVSPLASHHLQSCPSPGASGHRPDVQPQERAEAVQVGLGTVGQTGAQGWAWRLWWMNMWVQSQLRPKEQTHGHWCYMDACKHRGNNAWRRLPTTSSYINETWWAHIDVCFTKEIKNEKWHEENPHESSKINEPISLAGGSCVYVMLTWTWC